MTDERVLLDLSGMLNDLTRWGSGSVRSIFVPQWLLNVTNMITLKLLVVPFVASLHIRTYTSLGYDTSNMTNVDSHLIHASIVRQSPALMHIHSVRMRIARADHDA